MKARALPRAGRVVMELPGRTSGSGDPSAEIGLRRILVPTDFSESSRKAARYAESFARQFNAEILLLHVVEPVTPPPEVIIATYAELETQIRESAAKCLAEWRREFGSPSIVKANVRSGSPYREILRAAEETNTDLIIVGTRGRSGLAHVFMGSTAERVVRHASCPVLVVREHERDFVGASERKAKAPAQRSRSEQKRSANLRHRSIS